MVVDESFGIGSYFRYGGPERPYWKPISKSGWRDGGVEH